MRVDRVQNYLGRRILLENVSSYITYKHSVIPEWEFLAEVSRRSGCGILLDINNIYVNAVNHDFDPLAFVRGIPGPAVGYCHLAGHTDMGKWLFDTHSKPVIDPVWNLYRSALEIYGAKSTLIEWDEDIPDWPRLSAEAAKARKIHDNQKCGDTIRISQKHGDEYGDAARISRDRSLEKNHLTRPPFATGNKTDDGLSFPEPSSANNIIP